VLQRSAAPAGLLQALLGAPGPVKRRALAKAITLIESTRVEHRGQADELLNALLPHTGGAIRLGISGVPGVGKSSFIEVLGLQLTAAGHRVAVLAVDPSSSLGGGSILGDKTRMQMLSVDPAAFIRPSPTAGNLGGVTEKTREALLLCEAAGFDVVLVETVGVGQSETAVAGMTDLFVLLQLPNAGDDLQAIKKGVMELADLVLINKADLDEAAATRAQAQIVSSMRMLGQHRASALPAARVMMVSAFSGRGLPEFWQQVQQLMATMKSNGTLAVRRQHQAQAWMWERIAAGLQQRFKQHPAVQATLTSTTQQVLEGSLAASVAARHLLALLDTPSHPEPSQRSPQN
jgi:LAO/AO transport system kinase